MFFRLRSPLLKIVNKNTTNNAIKCRSTVASSAEKEWPNSTSPVEASTAGDSAGIKPKKAVGKLAARQPLVKNFLIGEVDKELLAFPEVIARDDMRKLQNEMLPIKSFFAESVDERAIEATRTTPPEVFEGIRDLGLYGVNVPALFGGKGWQWSQSLIAMEEEANCIDIAQSLLSHRVIIDVLNEAGTEYQKQSFLSKLASGAMVATEAIYEYNPSDFELFNTTAEYNPDNHTWMLNGEKAFIVTGPRSSDSSLLYLVIAQTHRLNTRGDGSLGTTIFLVDSATEGVKIGDQHLTIGCRGLQLSNVHFENVCVSENLVLGQPHDGNEVADVVQRCSRLRNASIGLGMAKNVVNATTQYLLDTKQCNVALNEMEINQVHLSKAICATYAMESMIYMTAGLLDEFEQPDVALEAAITKYFAVKQQFKIASKLMNIVGPKSLLAGQPTELFFRNSAQLYSQGESMDTLSLFIALTGLQHAGRFMNDSVRMSRNPLFHPAHIFGKFLKSSTINQPNTKMRLADNLHPSLAPAAQCLEHSVARLQMCTELLFTRYGNNVVEHHNEMQRLTDMITATYAIFASLSRASRSYCIGLQLADHELLTATAIASHGYDLVKTLAEEMNGGPYLNNDSNLQRLFKQVAKSKGCFTAHPLTYNF